MVLEPFYDLDGGIAVDLPGARGLFTTAAWGDVRERADAIGQQLGQRVVHAHQVHGNSVMTVESAPSQAALGVEVDALLTARAGVAPMVLTADCVPVLIAGGGAAAAVHAGWKGLRNGVITAALERLRTLAPEGQFAAAIGPAAGACCYEVGDDLHELFAERDQDFRSGQNLDLQEIARRQLEQAGIGTVSVANVCTICSEAPRMHSYRRDGGTAGRQGAIVWLT
jgi:YfiH family protein